MMPLYYILVQCSCVFKIFLQFLNIKLYYVLHVITVLCVLNIK